LGAPAVRVEARRGSDGAEKVGEREGRNGTGIWSKSITGTSGTVTS
jgi:hypothetical protein